ncbi:MAG TPA: MFS transporter [Chthonomonadaceae bacterium]|nr:MFS transporter [Chthonomonadaceae bacterium]
MSSNRVSPAPDAETRSLVLLERDWRLFILLNFLFAFGFGIYSGVFQNFLKDALNANPLQLGQLESLREIPGLLAAITAGTLVALAESRVAGLGLLITAVGIGTTGMVTDYAHTMVHHDPHASIAAVRYLILIGVTVFWSIGFHLWASVAPAITLALAKGLEGGRHLGRISAVGAIANLSALALSLAMAARLPRLGYKPYFILAGGCIGAAAVLCAMLSTHAEGGDRSRIILRREYGLYYLLSFLEGCRRQIFSIFASFALILYYKVPLGPMLALQFINAILISVTAPWIGRMVDRRGERGPLTFYSIGLIVVFLGYATFQNRYGLYALFLIDNVLFSFGVGFTTYLHRIVRPKELTPCLSMGVTMNHIAAVTVPVGGAWLWVHFQNYQAPFWVGVAIAAVSLVATRWLPAATVQPHPEIAR